MKLFLKVLASILTLLLLITSYYGIVEGFFLNTSFWLLYLSILAGVMLSIACLKKLNR
ncbi:hypothetical protein ASZ90_019106 [hydrocarbon metagenome]|uniref:Uncharacterized protein n=1 Tax=hydrocarbon metagenome TaxID=938273 RepID=A0A0W8E489_9ZZZZ